MCLAIPGQVLSISTDDLRTATVRFGAVTRSVSLAMVPEAKLGDFVIVHVGFAISKLDQESARRSLEVFATLAADDVAGSDALTSRPTRDIDTATDREREDR